MSDKFTSEERSEIMKKIRSKEGVAEKLVFSFLRTENVYFQKHYKRAEGTPDVALPRKKRAVFIDGDFWHGRDYKKLIENSKLSPFWTEKIAKNIERDKHQRRKLKEAGWQILAVWESDIKRKRTREHELSKIRKFLVSG